MDRRHRRDPRLRRWLRPGRGRRGAAVPARRPRIRFIRDASNPGADGPDAEGVTVAPDGFIYIASERDNSDKGINQNTILKVDPNKAGPGVVADQEWDITATLPQVTANTGIEAIEFIPDSVLTGQLWDSSKNKAYDPADYPGHGDGLFFVAVEDNGTVYAFALNADGSHHLVGSFRPGLGGAMALDYDTVLGVLWTVCDDGCENASAQVKFNGTETPDVEFFDAPTGLPVANFEGFATGSIEMCANGVRPVWWFQDGIEQGSLRTGTLPCVEPSTPVSTPPVTTPPVTTPPVTTPPVTQEPSAPTTTGSQTPGTSPSPTPVKPPGLPNTGDTSVIGLWGLVALAGLGVGAVLRRHRMK
ncbi:LPXTG cell wall anchor domain-containing protein [Propionibacteriaceae bacterium Y1923]